jgi:hypothetical protein
MRVGHAPALIVCAIVGKGALPPSLLRKFIPRSICGTMKALSMFHKYLPVVETKAQHERW